jgi:tRNA1(Val) A37 N6-methylase TrmN6
VLIFKYHDAENEYLALANTERLAYQQSWREGEKAGKVSLLRDINIHKPHRGHQDIINELQIPASGIKIVDSFEKLYTYWQDVFSVSILNKKFYKELSNWYFWAIKHVTFPNKPTQEMAVEKGTDLNDLIYEHNATNIIRLLTRLLFVWFIKEKKLIPEELFDLRTLQNNILNELTPCNENSSLFEQKNYNSVYYKAILQNLFFASLNCPLNPDDTDKRYRQFRGDETYGKHRGVDWMMRYKNYFKDPDAFLNMINACVPFLNGGLFECLDDKNQNLYIDGFSDNMTQGEELIVPDYLFFGHEEITDLSEEYGFSNKSTKQAPVKGLIQILNSYKFTITENTPIEEDVALDPELLGKVFENLLASYNPETKTTARKQTGSFYTPREIVNYMVDESLIAYLKNSILDNKSGAFIEFGKSQLGLFADIIYSGQIKLYENQKHEFKGKEKELDKLLHDLVSFDPGNPFKEFPEASQAILEALDKCKILDPACGSGAFPMGILQKMVHVLQKLDPENTHWKELQLQKALQDSEEAYEILDKKEREQKLIEINNAFDVNINDPDYARKLYLVENCIYGVDIQPIASQISKLRFFISLVVDQKVNKKAENFGIRPLPNLETKFVTANTLIGIEKPDIQVSLFETQTIKELEQELKTIRHKLFSAKTKETKLKYREKDKELRNAIANELKRSGWQNEAAEKLASWDPYDQNASSPFFDPEWMFDINDGFDIVIGNPPYKQVPKGIVSSKSYPFSEGKDKGKQNLYKIFVEASFKLSKREIGTACLIVQSSLLCDLSSTYTRKLLLKHTTIEEIIEFPKIAPTSEGQVFENVLQGTCVYRIINREPKSNYRFKISINNDITTLNSLDFELIVQKSLFKLYPDTFYIPLVRKGDFAPINLSKNNTLPLSNYLNNISQGDLNLTSLTTTNTGVKLYRGKNIQRFYLIREVEEYVQCNFKAEAVKNNLLYQFIVCQEITGTTDKFRLHFCITPQNEKYLFGHTANKLFPKKQSYLKPLVVILNSKFLDWLFRKTSTNNHVMGYEIVQFPIPVSFDKYKQSFEKLFSVINYIRTTRGNYLILIDTIANAFVYNLYFPKHMKENKIDVSEFIERDLNSVLENREFENLNNTEKEKVISQLHGIWTDPENEVVKRMAQFKEKSPDILKPILES